MTALFRSDSCQAIKFDENYSKSRRTECAEGGHSSERRKVRAHAAGAVSPIDRRKRNFASDQDGKFPTTGILLNVAAALYADTGSVRKLSQF